MVFTAMVKNATDTGLNWSVDGIPGGSAASGTIAADGAYTAPADLPSPASVQITATSHADPTKSGSAQLMIISDLGITIAPSAASVELGATSCGPQATTPGLLCAARADRLYDADAPRSIGLSVFAGNCKKATGPGRARAGRGCSSWLRLLSREEKLCKTSRVDVAEERGARRQQRRLQELYVKVVTARRRRVDGGTALERAGRLAIVIQTD